MLRGRSVIPLYKLLKCRGYHVEAVDMMLAVKNGALTGVNRKIVDDCEVKVI